MCPDCFVKAYAYRTTLDLLVLRNLDPIALIVGVAVALFNQLFCSMRGFSFCNSVLSRAWVSSRQALHLRGSFPSSTAMSNPCTPPGKSTPISYVPSLSLFSQPCDSERRSVTKDRHTVYEWRFATRKQGRKRITAHQRGKRIVPDSSFSACSLSRVVSGFLTTSSKSLSSEAPE
jgi:hypothetical protein